MNALTLSNHLRKSLGLPQARSFGGRRSRGATLITAIFATFGLSLFVGSTVMFVSSTYSLAWSRANSESALLLAEGGVNRELQYISKQMQAGSSQKSHSYKTLPGEPYPGEPMDIEGMPGKVWVYTTQPGSTNPWRGHGPAQVTCTAEVGGKRFADSDSGPTVTRKLTIQLTPSSIFKGFALFGLHAAGNGDQPSIGITGGSNVIIEGNVGTNGRVQGGAGEINFDRAYNYNARNGDSGQFKGDETFSYPTPLVMPTVTEILDNILVNMNNGYSEGGDAWARLGKHNDNDQIRQFKLVGGSLTSSGTQKAGTKSPPFTLSDSSFLGVNPRPLSVKRTLIFPPGDYYLTGLDLKWDGTTEILIDNAGLTTSSGNNYNNQQVRIWVNGASQQNYLNIPVRLTNENDLSTFRLYYANDGSVLNVELTSQFPSAELYVAGCIYAVTSKLNPTTNQPVDSSMKGTQIDFKGGSANSNQRIVIYGSLIADRVAFHGLCKLVFPSVPMNHVDDPMLGVGYSSNCGAEPCYSD